MKTGNMKMGMIGAGILAAGIIGMVVMVALKPEPPKVQPAKTSPLMIVARAEMQWGPLKIRGHGSVQPVREIDVASEVSGKVVDISEDFVGGGVFRQGQSLLRVDPSDYVNAVAVAEAEVTQRKYDVLTAEEEVTVAKDEWERLKNRTDVSELPESTDLGILVLKEPQLAAARAHLQSAEASLADARKRLERTHIRAPFNGIVRQKSADLGQFISPGQIVGRIYSTDAVEIRVPLSSRSASLVEGLWSRDTAGRQAHTPATISSTVGKRRYEYAGYIHRIEGAIETSTRTIGVVVRVDGAYESQDDRPPLFVGTFAAVELQGITPREYYGIPRSALREGNLVWVIKNERLSIVPVEVLQEIDNIAYITGDLDGEPMVVTSTHSVIADGMTVRVAE